MKRFCWNCIAREMNRIQRRLRFRFLACLSRFRWAFRSSARARGVLGPAVDNDVGGRWRDGGLGPSPSANSTSGQSPAIVSSTHPEAKAASMTGAASTAFNSNNAEMIKPLNSGSADAPRAKTSVSAADDCLSLLRVSDANFFECGPSRHSSPEAVSFVVQNRYQDRYRGRPEPGKDVGEFLRDQVRIHVFGEPHLLHHDRQLLECAELRKCPPRMERRPSERLVCFLIAPNRVGGQTSQLGGMFRTEAELPIIQPVVRSSRSRRAGAIDPPAMRSRPWGNLRYGPILAKSPVHATRPIADLLRRPLQWSFTVSLPPRCLHAIAMPFARHFGTRRHPRGSRCRRADHRRDRIPFAGRGTESPPSAARVRGPARRRPSRTSTSRSTSPSTPRAGSGSPAPSNTRSRPRKAKAATRSRSSPTSAPTARPARSRRSPTA